MTGSSHRKLITTLAAMLLAFASITALAGGTVWSYEGETGPEHWGTLNPSWSTCEKGNYQSPIDIRNTMKASLGRVEAMIKPTPLAFGLDGPTFVVHYQPGSRLQFHDVNYELKQFHFHHTSEHQLYGKSFPLEAHLVLQREGAKHQDAVLALFIKEGKENAMLSQLFGVLPRSAKKSRDGIMVDVGDLLPGSLRYFTYVGSMTTPDCSESVRWYVVEEPVEASREQIDAFVNDLTEGTTNNRPVQPRHGRPVLRDE